MRDWRGEVPHKSVCVVRTRPVIPDEDPDPLQFAQIGLAAHDKPRLRKQLKRANVSVPN
jgi:hypothetical protein